MAVHRIRQQKTGSKLDGFPTHFLQILKKKNLIGMVGNKFKINLIFISRYSSTPNVVVCTWIKTYLRWTQLVNMNALANKALPTVLNNSTKSKTNVHTPITLQQFLTLSMNETLIFEKSWEAGSRGTNKVAAIAD